MICVYKASGATDAYLVRHWLERNGIVALVRDGLLSVRGELPIGVSWPTVWVAPADRERAEEAIRAYTGPVLVHPPWKCPGCEEINEPNFGSCWSCGQDRPGLPEG